MQKLIPPNMLSKRSEDVTTFTWTIKNFEMCPNSYGKPLKSPEFSTHSWQAPKFQLLLYSRGINQKTSDNVSLYIVRTSGEESDWKLMTELGIMTVEGKETCFKFDRYIQKGSGKGLQMLVEREKLFSTERGRFLPDGNLTVFCEISTRNCDTTEYPRTSGCLESLVELSRDFSNFYEQEKFSDLELYTEDKTFKVHKALLDIRFPGLSEKVNSDSFKVENIGTSTMDSLLKYAYGAVFDKNQINLFELAKSPYEVPPKLKSMLITKTCRVHASTSFEKKAVSFSWKIQNCNSLTCESSMRYSLIGDESCPWTWFSIFLQIEKDDVDENLIFSIDRFSKESSRIICRIEAFGLNEIFEHTFQKENIWTLPAFVSKKTLLENACKASTDEATFEIEITVTNGSSTTQIKRSKFSSVDSSNQLTDNFNRFQEDLKKLSNDIKYCDIRLLVEEDELPAHKFVLSARSSVFSEIFQNEISDNKIRIEGFNSKVIKAVLQYVYFGKIKMNDKSAKFTVAMYNAANKYDLPGLKKAYTEILKLNTDETNAGDILMAAATWNDEKLKEHIFEFACNYPEKVANSEEWRDTLMERNDLAMELLTKTLLKLAKR